MATLESMDARKRSPKKTATRNGALDHVLTRRQLEERADAAARRMLGARDRREAFARLDRGELAGTVAEAEFSMLRTLLRARAARPRRAR